MVHVQEILTEAFPSNVTSTVLSNLLPGTSYDITVRARNLAGLSQPSNLVTHTTQASGEELVQQVNVCIVAEYVELLVWLGFTEIHTIF